MSDSKPDDERMQVEQGLRTLMQWAAGVQLSDIPASVQRKAALIIADNLAATVAARDEPEVQRAQQQLERMSGPPQATVFRGGRPRTDRVSATLANGIAQSWCELDEGYRLAPCHGGLYILPALLADAEALGLTVGETLRATVVSYEVIARIARCWVFPQLTLHPHPALASVGGAAACAAARGFDAALFFDAVTAACTLINVGHFQHAVEGALVRNVWAAVGGSNGMRCADWAQCGIGGMAQGPYSTFTTLLGQAPAPQHLGAQLGAEWAITQGYHKLHACCQSTHSAVEATLAAIERMRPGTSSADIDHMVLETHRPGMSNRAPPTTLASKFSFEHVLATTQVHGHAGAQAFAASALTDPAIARLRDRVELKAFDPLPPRPNDRPARLTIRFADGESLTSECLSARGGPDRPFDEQVIVDKVDGLTRAVYPRLTAVMLDVMALSKARMQQRWSDAVAELTGA